MIGPDAVARCQWLEPGGEQAAQVICAFLQEVGIRLSVEPIAAKMFVPGMDIWQGGLRIDPAVPAYPGDLLHEAGHIAVIERPRRDSICDVGTDPAEEMTAIAWSIAAARACGMPLDVVFHPAGYRGGSEALIAVFEQSGMGPGVPLLSAWGMSAEPRLAAEWGREPFPAMARWLR